MSFKNMVGKRMPKKVKFMGEEVEINKLSVAEVLAIQAFAKDNAADETNGLAILRLVIRSSVADTESVSDEEFEAFPMDELSKLSNEIMKFSGIAPGEAGK